MFRTHKHAEIPISALFGDEVRLWSYVEHGLHQPWFYVTLTERHEELALRNMLMVSDVSTLESLVSEQHRDMKIDAIQLVSPCYMNESCRWMMEPLLELSQVNRATAEPPVYIYCLEGGRQYLDGNEGPLSEEQISSRKVIFSALA